MASPGSNPSANEPETGDFTAADSGHLSQSPSGRLVAAKAPTHSADAKAIPRSELEIKDAQLIFNAVWQKLEQEYSRENLRFPKEIMWLGGAPGAGKGTNTPFIMAERGLTARPIVMSELLTAPMAREIINRGGLVGDREVAEVLLRALLRPEFVSGVVVDGFPRTVVQAQCVKLLHDKMRELRNQYFDTPIGPYFRRPLFRITVLFVDERISVERQLGRGEEVKHHNFKVRESGIGELQEERNTDLDPELARQRYRTFKEKTYAALESLRLHFHYHFVDAMAPVAVVEANIKKEFAYQSSLELDQDTFDAVSLLPLASELIKHARQELVRRLDNYQHRYESVFRQVVYVLEHDVVPLLRRHAIAGRAEWNTDNPLFDQAIAIDMAIDVLSERGYLAVAEWRVQKVPVKVDYQTNRVVCQEQGRWHLHVRFTPPQLRREG